MGIALLISPLFVSASTVEDLQAQLQALLAQIALLQQQNNGGADDFGDRSAAGNYCPALTMTLQRGARDESSSGQVTELQKFLSGYYDLAPEEIVTGYFGRITESYVIKFQQEQGLPAYGIVGALTRAKIARV